MSKMMSNFQEIPINSAEVLQVLNELVLLPRDFRPDALRHRGWTVLPGVESLTFFDEWLEETLNRYEVEKLLILFKGIDANHITRAGWLRPNLEGLRFLEDASISSCYLAVAPEKDIAWWQFYTDDFYLAGDESFISDVFRNSFKTLVECYLAEIKGFEDSGMKQHMKQFCQQYEEFFPLGVHCNMTLPTASMLNKNLVEIDASPSAELEAMLVCNRGVRLLSKSALQQRDWLCIVFSFQPDFGLMSWAKDAERIAWAVNSLQVTQLLGFIWSDDGAKFAYTAPVTRDSILAFRNMCFQKDILITSEAGDFVVLGSAGQFFLVAGSRDFVGIAMGGQLSLSLTGQDSHLRDIEENAPEVGDVLGEAMLEYFDLF